MSDVRALDEKNRRHGKSGEVEDDRAFKISCGQVAGSPGRHLSSDQLISNPQPPALDDYLAEKPPVVLASAPQLPVGRIVANFKTVGLESGASSSHGSDF